MSALSPTAADASMQKQGAEALYRSLAYTDKCGQFHIQVSPEGLAARGALAPGSASEPKDGLGSYGTLSSCVVRWMCQAKL